MAIEAPLSKYKKGNLKIYIIVCILLAIWFAYDGYYNKKFIEKHTSSDGVPDATLTFHKKSPYFLLGAGIVLWAYFWAVKGRKLVADENGLSINGEKVIPYSSIEAIDKTHFAAKGIITITYKDSSGKLATKQLSDRTYDNFAAILDDLVTKIS